MSKTFFISFSGSVGDEDNDLQDRQKLLNQSSINVSKVDGQFSWTRKELLQTNFYRQNKYLLDQPRGAGYWLWKPYIILETLKQVNKNDWVVYSDVGKPFRRNDSNRAGNAKIGNVMNVSFDSLTNYSDQHNGFTPGIWIPHYGSAKVWTKRDCFVGMSCDEPKYHNSGLVQAGYSCWSKSTASIAFLNQWIHWCKMKAIVSDQLNIYGKPNFNQFKDHRHDQSILTNLVVRNDIPLFGPKKNPLAEFRDFNQIIRHMSLENNLSKEVEHFSCLFKPFDSILPNYLKQILSLRLLPELRYDSIINVHNFDYFDCFQGAFPSIKIEHNPSQRFNSVSNEKYIAVFANECEQFNQFDKVLVASYESLLPGGLLIMGPFKGEQAKTPKLNASFNELLAWMFINQRFPSYLSNNDNQKKNSITLGNANNPLIINQEVNQNYLILRKPHMGLAH